MSDNSRKPNLEEMVEAAGLESTFYAKLLELPNIRINIDEVRRIYAELYPDHWSHPARVDYIHSELQSLANHNLIKFPGVKNRAAWLRESSPMLPAWIKLVKQQQGGQQKIDPSQVPWLAEMRFSVEMTNSIQIEAAVAINKFLIERRHSLTEVPLRERSLQIFGDEKRLDLMVRKGTLFNGRLPISAIGAIEIEPPLAYRRESITGRPIIVVENHHSYWSICEWNSRCRRYAAVVYGAGNTLNRAVRAIDSLVSDSTATGVEYFGDLDPRGLQIPYNFNQSHAQRSKYLLNPALKFYEWLCLNGVRSINTSTRKVDDSIYWLPPQLACGVLELFKSGRRIAQENLGLEELMRFMCPQVCESDAHSCE